MIHIGAIRKIFRGWRILICAWVDDNSPLKSQFFMLFRGDNGKSISRSERVRPQDRHLPAHGRYALVDYPICRETPLAKNLVWFGLGKFMDGEDSNQ